MKRLLIAALALMVALPASAQTYFREVTTHWLDFDTTARSTTVVFPTGINFIRLVATTGVYYGVAWSGAAQTAASDQATTVYLPGNTDRIIKVDSGSTVVAIARDGNGLLLITELSQ